MMTTVHFFKSMIRNWCVDLLKILRNRLLSEKRQIWTSLQNIENSAALPQMESSKKGCWGF